MEELRSTSIKRAVRDRGANARETGTVTSVHVQTMSPTGQSLISYACFSRTDIISVFFQVGRLAYRELLRHGFVNMQFRITHSSLDP